MNEAPTSKPSALTLLIFPSIIGGSIASTWLLFPLFPDHLKVLAAIGTVYLAVAAMLILERALPYRKEWNGNKKDTFSDVVRSFLILPSGSKLAELTLVGLLFPLFDGQGIWPAFQGLHWGIQLPIIVLVSEFTYYWTHRWMHHSKFLWRFHAVHHGAGRVYLFNAGRFHSLEAYFTGLCYYLPVILLAPTELAFTLFIGLSAVTGFMEHVNIRFRMGWLKYIFNGAPHHRWHHSEQVAESNKNFGKVLIVFDLLFGTFYLPKGETVQAVGVDGKKVPENFIGQLKFPFGEN